MIAFIIGACFGVMIAGMMAAAKHSDECMLAEEVKQMKPERHGRWVYEFELDGHNFYRCSVCNRQEVLLAKYDAGEWFPYCHCGAKMYGGA